MEADETRPVAEALRAAWPVMVELLEQARPGWAGRRFEFVEAEKLGKPRVLGGRGKRKDER